MKKSVLYLAAATLILPVMTTSCKKGENDPFLSLRSRKNRVVGEWTLDQFNIKTTRTGTSTPNSSSVLEDGVITNVDEFGTEVGDVETSKWTFKRDGTWTNEFVVTYNTTTNLGGTTQNQLQFNTDKRSGSWNFLGRVDDFKNKERIILNVLESQTTSTTTINGVSQPDRDISFSATYRDGDVSMVFLLDQLKHKEMVVVEDGTATFNSGQNNTTTVREGKRVFIQD